MPRFVGRSLAGPAKYQSPYVIGKVPRTRGMTSLEKERAGWRLDPATLQYVKPKKRHRRIGPTGEAGPDIIQELIDRTQAGKAETKGEYDIPWNELKDIIEDPAKGGMTNEEAALLRERGIEGINRWGGTEAQRISRLPAGIGASAEAERELLDAIASKKGEVIRETELGKLESQREGRMGTINALAQLAMSRQAADIAGTADAGALLQAVMSGAMSAQQLAAMRYTLGLGGYGTGGQIKMAGGYGMGGAGAGKFM